jgi:hypothetical protein
VRPAAWSAVGLFAAMLALALPLSRIGPDSYDAQIMMQVTAGMVETHVLPVRPAVDPFGLNTPYPGYGLGQSLAMAPLYWLGRRLGVDPVASAMKTNAVLFAGLAVVLYGWALLAGLGRREALATAALVCVATPLVAYAGLGFSEVGVALCLAAGLVAVELLAAGHGSAAALAGVAAAAALLLRKDSLGLVVPWLAVATVLQARRPLRAVLLFTAAAAPGTAAWLAYNHLRYGSPFVLGMWTPVFNHPLLPGLYGLVLSPGRGLLIHAPLVLVAAAGARSAWRRAPLLVALAGTLLAARLVFYARWWSWHGGTCWGPRFLVPAMPLLALGLAEVVGRWDVLPASRRALVGLVVALSLATQLVGAVGYYENTALSRASSVVPADTPEHFHEAMWSAETQRRIDATLFSWRYLPLAEAGHLSDRSWLVPFAAGRLRWLASGILLLLAGMAFACGERHARASKAGAVGGRSGARDPTRVHSTDLLGGEREGSHTAAT